MVVVGLVTGASNMLWSQESDLSAKRGNKTYFLSLLFTCTTPACARTPHLLPCVMLQGGPQAAAPTKGVGVSVGVGVGDSLARNAVCGGVEGIQVGGG